MHKKPLSQEDLDAAREILFIAGEDVVPSRISYESYMDLVKVRYPDIKGIPLEKISRRQLRMIGARMYLKALYYVGAFNEDEKAILESILSVFNLKKRDKKYFEKKEFINDRLCMQSRHLSQEDFLVRLFQDVLKHF